MKKPVKNKLISPITPRSLCMTFKRTLLPLYAVVAIFAFATNFNLQAMKQSESLQNLQQTHEQTEQLLKALETKITTLEQKDNAKLQEEIQQLKTQLQTLTAQNAQTITLLQQQINAANQPNPQLQNLLQQIQQQQTTLQQQAITLQKLQQKDDSISKLKAQFRHIITSPLKLAAACIAIPLFARLVHKDEPAEKPLGLTEGLKGFVTINPLSKAYYTNILRFIDDVIIGFKGKKRGFFQVGASRIGYDGQKQVVAEITRPTANGTGTEKVAYSTYGNAMPYGLLGNALGYIMTLKRVDEFEASVGNAGWALDTITPSSK